MSDQKCTFCNNELDPLVRAGDVARCSSPLCIHSVVLHETIEKFYFRYNKEVAEERIDKIIKFFKDLYKD